MVCRMTTAGEPRGSTRGLPSWMPACSPAAHPLSSTSDASHRGPSLRGHVQDLKGRGREHCRLEAGSLPLPGPP